MMRSCVGEKWKSWKRGVGITASGGTFLCVLELRDWKWGPFMRREGVFEAGARIFILTRWFRYL